MNPKISELNKKLQPYRNEIVKHKLYSKLKTKSDIKKLMESHVFAVWDFMSLLKALQINLTCFEIPWRPIGDPKIRRLVNSIVLEEESDVDSEGNPASHFELYLEAMKECEAETSTIETFMKNLNKDSRPKINEDIDSFLNTTFSIIEGGKSHEIASAFTFGREDLIPDMFIPLIEGINADNNHLNKLIYYFKRHIEVDGDMHGPMSMEMLSYLCNNDAKKISESSRISKDALHARISLWNGIEKEIKQRKNKHEKV